MLKTAIIVGSTRPGRLGESVAQWVYNEAKKRTDSTFEVVDIKDYNLPLLDEPVPPSLGNYQFEHTKRWAEKIASFDAFVFVTAEYNHSMTGALKNAIDFLYAEWNNKAAGFVSYGGGGLRAVEQLRQIMAEIQIADVRAQVRLSLADDFENWTVFKPSEVHAKSLQAMLDQVVSWGNALKTVRNQ